MPADIRIGRVVPTSLVSPTLDIRTEDQRLQGEIEQSWMKTHIYRSVGYTPNHPEAQQEGAVIRDLDRSKSILVTGGSGSGKTMLSEIIIEQEIYQGSSVVILDPKPERIDRAIYCARMAGLQAQQVTVIAPWLDKVPGYNTLVPPAIEVEIAASFTATVIEQSLGAGGARMKNLYQNGFTFAGGIGGNLLTFQRLLLDEGYRSRLLANYTRPLQHISCDRQAFNQAREFFLLEYNQWSKGSRSEAIAPVLNRVRALTRSSFLTAVLAASEATLDFSSLWREQRLIIIYTNPADLGEGAGILCGLTTNLLLRTAFRTSGPRPVLLVADEMSTLEKVSGGAIPEIASTCRSRGLKMLVCTQDLEQLSPELSKSLLTNASTMLFFRATTDARILSQLLSVGAEKIITQVTVEAQTDKTMPGGVTYTSLAFEIRNAHGEVLELTPQAFQILLDETNTAADPTHALRLFANMSGVVLYVIDPSTGEPIQLEVFINSIPEGRYFFDGPKPLHIVVLFPKPKISGIQKRSGSDLGQLWMRTLLDLPTATFVLKSAGLSPQIVKIDRVSEIVFDDAHDRFVAASMDSIAQSWRNQITTAEDIEFDAYELSDGSRNKEEDINDPSIA